MCISSRSSPLDTPLLARVQPVGPSHSYYFPGMSSPTHSRSAPHPANRISIAPCAERASDGSGRRIPCCWTGSRARDSYRRRCDDRSDARRMCENSERGRSTMGGSVGRRARMNPCAMHTRAERISRKICMHVKHIPRSAIAYGAAPACKPKSCGKLFCFPQSG